MEVLFMVWKSINRFTLLQITIHFGQNTKRKQNTAQGLWKVNFSRFVLGRSWNSENIYSMGWISHVLSFLLREGHSFSTVQGNWNMQKKSAVLLDWRPRGWIPDQSMAPESEGGIQERKDPEKGLISCVQSMHVPQLTSEAYMCKADSNWFS